MPNKIEDALFYNKEKDGLPRGRGNKPTKCEDANCCPKLKTAAYYKTLAATRCTVGVDAAVKASFDR